MTTTTQDSTIAHDGAFIRLIQPDEPTAPFIQSSYFRLGRYVAQNDEEKNLKTDLKTTRCHVDPHTTIAGAVPKATIKNMKDVFAVVGKINSDNKPIVDPPITSNNDGILIFTDHDLNENIKGAALQKFGQGHVVEVGDADASYSVKYGKFDLFAQNGLFFGPAHRANGQI